MPVAAKLDEVIATNDNVGNSEERITLLKRPSECLKPRLICRLGPGPLRATPARMLSRIWQHRRDGLLSCISRLTFNV